VDCGRDEFVSKDAGGLFSAQFQVVRSGLSLLFVEPCMRLC
jgi:hypothetical protein